MINNLTLQIGGTQHEPGFITVNQSDALNFVRIVQPKSLQAARIYAVDQLQSDKDFWITLYATLKDNAIVNTPNVNSEAFLSFVKMAGFTNINTSEGELTFQKPQFKSGGTSLKDRKKI